MTRQLACATAFSSLGCPDLALPAVAALAKANRIDGIELRALGSQVDLPAYFAEHYGTPQQLRAATQELGVPVLALGTSLRLIGNTAEARENFRSYIVWAQALDVPFLRVFDGGQAADDAELAEADDTLAWWEAEKAAHGYPVNIIVETHDSLADPVALERFVARFPRCRLLWDTHHTWRRSGEAPSRTWSRIGPSVVHMHVKDSVIAAGTRHGYRYVPLGEGEFPLSDLFDVLQSSRFPGAVSLEWERLWHPSLLPLADVLPAYRQLFS